MISTDTPAASSREAVWSGYLQPTAGGTLGIGADFHHLLVVQIAAGCRSSRDSRHGSPPRTSGQHDHQDQQARLPHHEDCNLPRKGDTLKKKRQWQARSPATRLRFTVAAPTTSIWLEFRDMALEAPTSKRAHLSCILTAASRKPIFSMSSRPFCMNEEV